VAGPPSMGPRKPKQQAPGPFRPGARLNADTSQVVDERGMAKPYDLVHYEDGDAWVPSAYPGGLVTDAHPGNRYSKGAKPPPRTRPSGPSIGGGRGFGAFVERFVAQGQQNRRK
jgi:hypothetical protein